MKVSKKISITIKQTLIIFSPDSFFLKMPYGYYRRWGNKARLARNVSRAYKKGNKTTLVEIPSHVDLSFSFSSNNKYSDILMIKPFDFSTESTAWFGALTNFRVYEHYSELFDEARIVGYRCKLTVNNGGTLTGGFLSVVSTIDRNFGPEDLAETMSSSELMNNPGVMKQTMTNQSRGIFYRSVYPTSLLEKASYFDCTIHNTASNVEYIPGYEKMVTGFRPAIYYMLHKDAGTSGTTTIAARLEITTVMQFRNPKYQEIDAGDRGVRVVEKKIANAPEESFSSMAKTLIEEKKEEEPVLKKKKVVYEEEVLPDDEDEEMDEDEQEPLTQPLKPAMKKAGKKSS